jgi:hypothetical protein
VIVPCRGEEGVRGIALATESCFAGQEDRNRKSQASALFNTGNLQFQNIINRSRP